MHDFGWLKPIKLPPSENYIGCALDYHRLVYGARTYVGEMLYELKYHANIKYAEPLAEMMAWCIKKLRWDRQIGAIIGVPPVEKREVQPVNELVRRVGKKLRKRYTTRYFEIAEDLSPMKSIRGGFKEQIKLQKMQMLEGKVRVKDRRFEGQRILLIDDIYETGATLEVITRLLREDGGVREIYVMVVTRAGKFGIPAYGLKWPLERVDFRWE